ncbi:MAG: beta-lactamase family protein [Hyphomonadaceae bacterium JAD_PAG50586_4]|nr:MAG: beta-lactamase family protein [Hyphomonadaceae bacterium JAD_PAG50586_4]
MSAGFGVLDDGRLVWSHYYGEEAPGLAVTAATRFNVASITKTVTAEVTLRLIAAGHLDLDEPLSAYWIDPDIAADARRDQLTARMVLNHTSGFPNWRFFRPNRRLVFEHVPGSAYGYSGEAFEYLARAIEIKLSEPFPSIVDRVVFEPTGIDSATLVVERNDVAGLVHSVDEQGAFPGFYCRPGGWCREQGSYSAADDLIISVSDYAQFMISVMHHHGYDASMADVRDRVSTDRGRDNAIDCSTSAMCPQIQGYGLGFEVVDFGAYRAVGHGGSDWSEQSLAYFYAPSGDGVIIFLNAPNARTLVAMPDLLTLLDAGSPYLERYRNWRSEAARE